MWRSSTVKMVLAGGVVAASAVAVAVYMSRSKTKKPIINYMIKEFQMKHVHIRDPERVERIVTDLIKDGHDNLQVVSDFDRTITRFMFEDRKVPTCHGVLDDCPALPESYRDKANKLRAKYLPLEFSNNISIDEKYNLMVEWWTSAHNLLVDAGLKRADLKEMIAKSGMVLREGSTKLFKQLNDAGVPCLVFSAGIGDVLAEAITQFSKFFPNMQIVSNFMDFDEQDNLVGFKGEMIHTYNKHEVAVHHPEYFERHKHRTNVILLGDTLGDLTMADGMPQAKNVLTIGFLNDHIDQNLESYKDSFDIVLISDETMDLPNAILQKVL